MRRSPLSLIRQLALLPRRCALVLALGALGLALVVLLPTTRLGTRRKRRAQRCGLCRRHQRWQQVVVMAIAVLVLAGSGMRVYQHVTHNNPPRCGTQWFLHGHVPELTPTHDLSPVWQLTRNLVTAPATGLAYGYAQARGMGLCTVGPLTVAFLPSAAGTSGTTVGDVFLTQVEPGLNGSRAEALGAHESRHVGQWTVLTLAAGPLALPVLYAADEIFFPGARNHFERDAGLSAGGYPKPASFAPQPVWGGVAVLAAVAALLLRRRIRWLSRLARGGAVAGARAEPGRCPVHSRGWFRSP